MFIIGMINSKYIFDEVNDYEEDNANYGEDSVGWIAAHLKAKDMG